MKNYVLGNIDIKKIVIGLLVAEGGVILATAGLWLQSGNLDLNKLLLLEEGAILSTLVNTFRKVLDGEVQ
jgi:hypothetical protein